MVPPKRQSIPPPSLVHLALESRTLLELTSLLPAWPVLSTAPKGDGHPVIVYPGFMAGNVTTLPLRYFLKQIGYEPLTWQFGRNRGQFLTIHPAMIERIQRVCARTGKKVTLLGWSLGGVYARELAKTCPEQVRQVITLGSPFSGSPRATNVAWLFEKITGYRLANLEEQVRETSLPPPVPMTAIYTLSDGIVSWKCTVEESTGPSRENIQVPGSHLGLGHNPLVLWIIADRLAQGENAWRPFEVRGLAKLLLSAPGVHGTTSPSRPTRESTSSWHPMEPRHAAPPRSQAIRNLDRCLRRLEALVEGTQTGT